MFPRLVALAIGFILLACSQGDAGSVGNVSMSSSSAGTEAASQTMAAAETAAEAGDVTSVASSNSAGSGDTSATTALSMTATSSASGTVTGPGTSAGTTSVDTSTTDGVTAGTTAGTTTSTSASTTGSTTGGDNCGEIPGTNATLTGRVFAPNGALPVSGALVYFTPTAPDPLPTTVYCQECVELSCEIPWTLSQADGRFSLPVVSGSGYLVVRKGQFMRSRALVVNPGTIDVAADLTTLPGASNPQAGDSIPKIAVALGSYDLIEDVLAKVGLADTITNPLTYTQATVPGSERYDLWLNGTMPSNANAKGSFATLLADYQQLSQYHIIFVPCSDDLNLGELDNPQVLDNIRNWVAAGGKWYVSDWSHEFLEIPFAQYQNFYPPGDADVYDSLATVMDSNLLAWLQALDPKFKDINSQNNPLTSNYPTLNQLPKLQTVDNWSGISDAPTIYVQDAMGNQVNVGHKPWIAGPGGGADVPVAPDHPMTVTGQYGCGRIMFTTYHTTEDGAHIGLAPQELVLFYLILEIGVCLNDLPVPV